METKCKICGKTYKSINGLGIHISCSHNISTKEYYDIFLREKDEGKCQKCGTESKFLGLRDGYSKYCSQSCANSVAGKICIEKHPEIIKKLIQNIGYAHEMHTKKKKERIFKEKPKSLDIENLIKSIKKVRKQGFKLISDVWGIDKEILENAWDEHLRRVRAKAGYICFLKHPEKFTFTHEEVVINSNKGRESLRRNIEREPEKYHKILSEAGTKGIKIVNKNLTHERRSALAKKGIQTRLARDKDSLKKNGSKTYKMLRETKYKYDEQRFLSKEEIECYKFLKTLGLSRDEINHDYQVDSCFIDFFPLGKFFWEYHPTWWLDGETPDQYYQRRRELLDTNGYQDYKLIVTTSLKEMDIIERELND